MILGLNEDNYAHLANQFITYNQHYLGIALGYDITPLLRAELFGIWDIEGDGIFLSPSATYNISDNIDVTANLFWADVFDDEFKVQSDDLGLQIKTSDKKWCWGGSRIDFDESKKETEPDSAGKDSDGTAATAADEQDKEAK